MLYFCSFPTTTPAVSAGKPRVLGRLATVAILLLLSLWALPAFSQDIVLTMENGRVDSGSEITLPVSVSTSSTSGLQWTYTFNPALVSVIEFTASESAVSAGKELTCRNGSGEVKCVLSGLGNATPIPTGAVAYLKLAAAVGPPEGGEPIEMPLSLASTYGVDPDGGRIPATAGNATLTINQIPSDPETPQALSPASVSLYGSQRAQFTAQGVESWRLTPNLGTISATGLYTAPRLIETLQNVTVTAVFASSTLTASIELRPAQIRISPTQSTLDPGESIRFSATVIDAPNTNVTWSRSPAIGTLNSAGLFRAPSTVAETVTVEVTATSVHDPGKTATAIVTIQPSSQPEATVTPQSVSLPSEGTVQFMAPGATDWRLSPNTGTITSTGLYTAPLVIQSLQTVTVTAVFPNSTATATIELRPVQVSVTPAQVTLGPNETVNFTATVVDASDTRVSWSRSANIGNMTAAGLFRAPASVNAQVTLVVTAMSLHDRTKTAAAIVTIRPSAQQAKSITPASASLASQGTVQFSAPGATSYQVSPSAGSITPNGLYTAPLLIPGQQTVTVTAVFPNGTATAAVTLRPAQVRVTPASVIVGANETVNLTASVIDANDKRVSWSRSANIGSMTPEGSFRAPNSVTSTTILYVTAMSLHDRTKTSRSTITIRPSNSTINVTPQLLNLAPGGSQQFVATLTGFTNKAVTWSMSPSFGTLSAAGLYKAPATVATETTVLIKATSVQDPSRSATATVTISPSSAVQVYLAPAVILMYGGGSQQFTATVKGAANTAVTWSISPAIGTISSTGKYTAPVIIGQQTNVTIRATSVADPSRFAQATVTLLPNSDGGFLSPN